MVSVLREIYWKPSNKPSKHYNCLERVEIFSQHRLTIRCVTTFPMSGVVWYHLQMLPSCGACFFSIRCQVKNVLRLTKYARTWWHKGRYVRYVESCRFRFICKGLHAGNLEYIVSRRHHTTRHFEQTC